MNTNEPNYIDILQALNLRMILMQSALTVLSKHFYAHMEAAHRVKMWDDFQRQVLIDAKPSLLKNGLNLDNCDKAVENLLKEMGLNP